MGASGNSYKRVYFYTCIKICHFYVNFHEYASGNSYAVFPAYPTYTRTYVYFFVIKYVSSRTHTTNVNQQSTNAGNNTTKGEIPCPLRAINSRQ